MIQPSYRLVSTKMKIAVGDLVSGKRGIPPISDFSAIVEIKFFTAHKSNEEGNRSFKGLFKVFYELKGISILWIKN